MKLFGTDGIRGKFQEFTYERLFDIFDKLLQVFSDKNQIYEKQILLGEDTRSSSSCISSNIIGILTSKGYSIIYGGVMTSGAVALLTKHYHCMLGIIVTASHNQASDNGLKFFNSIGEKFSRELETLIEKKTVSSISKNKYYSDFGRFQTLSRERWNRDYFSILTQICKEEELQIPSSLNLDLSHGSYSSVNFKQFLPQLKKISLFNAHPNGLNININQNFKASQIDYSDVVYRYDGDGDRCSIWKRNNLIEGVLIFLLGLYQKKKKAPLVTTYMTNEGIIRAIKKLDIEIKVVDGVGDLLVYEYMKKNNISLGAEPSGHVILGQYCKVSDGFLTTILLSNILKEEKALELLEDIKIWPSYDINFYYSNTKEKKELSKGKIEEISNILAKFPESKKIIRFSGTEPILRLHIESKNLNELNSIKEEIKNV